jgi:hypothetical protein
MSVIADKSEQLRVKEPKDIGIELGQRVLDLLNRGQSTNKYNLIEFIQDCPPHRDARIAFLTELGLDISAEVPLQLTKLLTGNGNVLVCEPLIGTSMEDITLDLVYGWNYSVVHEPVNSSETV